MPPAAPTAHQLGLMQGSPPASDRLVTLENWQKPPWNRWSFQHVRELIPSARISRGRGPVRELPHAPADLDGLTFVTSTGPRTLAALLDAAYADGFIVLHRGRIVAEQYFNGMERDAPHLLQSVSKSIVGALVGILAGSGRLDAKSSVSTHVPELAGTSFDGATVRDLLDMTTGTSFSEDYGDADSDVSFSEKVLGWRPLEAEEERVSLLDYVSRLPSEREHGELFGYRSILTDVLAIVVERAAGQRFADAVSGLLWSQLGAGYDAEVTVDPQGYPMADGGISVTLRDLARFGQLYLQSGNWDGHQIVPAGWANDTRYADQRCRSAFARSPDARRLGFCDRSATECYTRAHYRNQWWVLDPELGVLLASGIYGQTLYVNMFANVVVGLLCSQPAPFDYTLAGDVLQACAAISSTLTLLQ